VRAQLIKPEFDWGCPIRSLLFHCLDETSFCPHNTRDKMCGTSKARTSSVPFPRTRSKVEIQSLRSHVAALRFPPVNLSLTLFSTSPTRRYRNKDVNLQKIPYVHTPSPTPSRQSSRYPRLLSLASQPVSSKASSCVSNL
jgi:hypothetical protein